MKSVDDDGRQRTEPGDRVLRQRPEIVGAHRQLVARAAVGRTSNFGRSFPSLAVARAPAVAVRRARGGSGTRLDMRERVAARPEADCFVGHVVRGRIGSRSLKAVDGGCR